MSETPSRADWVLHNARLYTVDPSQPRAEALAVRDGRLALVGMDRQVLDRFPDAARVDAGGRTVVPGLIDAHAHLMGLGHSLQQANLTGARTPADAVTRLQAFGETAPRADWLLGHGWDQNRWPGTHYPTRYDLDAAFPDRPVWLKRIDHHAAWANTAALRRVGLEQLRARPDPEGGQILRDADGEPTGLFLDTAMRFVEACIPAPDEAGQEHALRCALDQTRRHGLTSVHEAGLDLATVARYRRAIDAGRFPLRLYGMIDGLGATFDHFCRHGALLDYGGRLTVRAVKFFIDGALGSRGAALLDDYSDAPGSRGLLLYSPDDFRASVQRTLACGFQVSTHAIGDRGVRVVLDAYEQAFRTAGQGAGRHRVEHAQVVAPEDFARFAALGVLASVQPAHATSDMRWAERRLGAERVRGAYAWRRLLDHSAHLAFGSDFPIEHVDPIRGFHAAVTRQDAAGHPEGGWHPGQCLTREEALQAFTLDAAFAAFQEDRLGSLEAGKWADFVVLSQDLMTVPNDELLDTTVVATYLDGIPVYGRL